MLKKGIAAAIVAGFAAVFASVAMGANIICLAGSESCDGTGVEDTITGSIDVDNIHAFGGDDQILPNAGNDVVNAGPGVDRVEGNDSGSDALKLGPGGDFVNETVDLVAGNTVNGGPGPDCLGGGSGDDTIRGGTGNERTGRFLCGGGYSIYGFEGDDRLIGGKGRDGIVAEEGADLLAGGKGNDYLDAKSLDGEGNDTLRCGTGKDKYSASSGDIVAKSCERRVPPPDLMKGRVARW